MEKISLTIEKPRRNDDGSFKYIDTLPFLAMYYYNRIPNSSFLWGLANQIMKKGSLSPKQSAIANEIIRFAEKEGVL